MNPKSITIKINEKNVTIEKLPLRKIADVFRALERLPKKFTDKFAGEDLKNIPNDKIIEMLPELISDFLPEVARLIAAATPLKEEEVLDELGLSDAIEVLVTIFQVNDFSKVVDNVKKLMARKPLAGNNSKTIGSTGPSIS